VNDGDEQKGPAYAKGKKPGGLEGGRRVSEKGKENQIPSIITTKGIRLKKKKKEETRST